MNIEAVIFDFNGIINSYCGNEAYWEVYEEYLELPEGSIRKTMCSTDISNSVFGLFSGILSSEDFESIFVNTYNEQHALNVRNLNIVKDFDEFGDSSILEEPHMKDILSKLRNCNIKTALLTNNYYIDRKKAQRKLPSNRDSFDVLVESCIEGIMKPHPEIYKITLDRLDVTADKCIFIDDQNYNCETADILGMKSILMNPLDTGAVAQQLDMYLHCQKSQIGK
uniref:HAD family phosphatase n=1 Tax=Rhabditophanes sp. KR3021 TaxID=114890 RepID=A0AC35UDY5_9BILA